MRGVVAAPTAVLLTADRDRQNQSFPDFESEGEFTKPSA